VGEVAIGIGITVADSTTVHSLYRRRAKSYALKIVPCGMYRRIGLCLMDSFVTRGDVSRDGEALSELDQ
jgi:hypothetical protein